jgi:hypothetical protein
MNAMRPGLPDPLLQLLGAAWTLGAPVRGAAWFDEGGSVGFGLADGTVAIARASWEGAAQLKPRDGGGVELVPAEAAAPPVTRIGVHAGPILCVAGDGQGGLVTGGADGRLARVGVGGEIALVEEFPGGSVEVVAAAAGVAACAVGATVYRFDGAGRAALDLPGPVAALAFDPAGRQLAIAHAAGVTLWSGDPAQPTLLSRASGAGALAWSAGGDCLVSGGADRVCGWRLPDGFEIAMGEAAGPVRSLSYSIPGGFMATSGGARVACWQLDGAAATASRRECGVGSSAPVARVACHPTRLLVAAGYDNGAVLLCHPGAADILFVRAAGGGAVSALAWSPDGAFLALGVEGGEVGVVAFPDLLFRPNAANGPAVANGAAAQQGAGS